MITFYFNNKPVNHFNDTWTNRILFEKIQKKEYEKDIHLFIIRPGENPFEVINSSLNKNDDIIIWYMDTVSNGLYDSYRKSINMLCEIGYNLKVIIPNYLDKYDLSCEVFNNYSMADSILEQQQINHKLIKYFYNESKFFYRDKYFLSFN